MAAFHRRSRAEVVVVQIQLLGVGMEVVHLLGIAGGAQCRGGEHLGEPALEQTRTMHPAGQDAGHGADLANLVEAASIPVSYTHLTLPTNREV